MQLGNALFVGRFVVNQKQRELSARLDALLGNGAQQKVDDASGTSDAPPTPPGPERPAPDPAAVCDLDPQPAARPAQARARPILTHPLLTSGPAPGGRTG